MEDSKAGMMWLSGKKWYFLVPAIIALFFIFCFRVVGVGQVGIITRFGNIAREAQSGVVIKAPWPIEHLVKMDIRTQKEQQDAAAATHDLQNVTTTVALNYNLTGKTAFDVYRNIGTDYKTVIIDPTLQNSVKAITSQYDAADLIAKRTEVAQKLTDLLTSKLLDRGITVTTVNIVNFGFSQEFNASIEAKQIAQQNAQKAEYDLQKANLDAQSNQVQNAALSDAILEQQAINKWDGKMPNYLGSGSVFNIPLTK
ncbi:MAG: mitochondrial prohibitin complex protein 1 [Candidatus Saccharibacteria bacterium]|nr:mitochondrial prohibitin complex protein 1 [Candidatus Saccharibacteria bacterium]